MGRTSCSVVGLVAVWLWAGSLAAANYTASPSDNLQTKINALSAGDTLTLSAGTYNVNFLSVTKVGSAGAWITIQGAPGGARPVLNNPGLQNMFNVVNSKFVKFAHLEIKGGANGEDAFKFTGSTCSDLIVEDCYMHNIGGHGISCSSLSAAIYRLTVRDCEISYTGGNAEAMYLGNNAGTAPVMNSVFERNYMHHTLAGAPVGQGDGIDLNLNSAGNIFRDNVIHDTHSNCITDEAGPVASKNLFERNVGWNCAADSGIQTRGGAIIRNNIFFNCAINAANLGGTNLEVYNNIFYSASGQAVNFQNGINLKFANNIVDGEAHQGGTIAGTYTHNYWKLTAFGTNQISGAPGYNPGSKNFYPTQSNYVNAGWNSDSDVPTVDFNTAARSGAPDIGAYELTTTSNPGWTIVAGFKSNNLRPTITSAAGATPNPVVSASTTTVAVSASDPDSGPAPLSYTWSKVSGPGTVSFSPNGTGGSASATATFSASGTYSVKVTVSDGALAVSSTLSGLSVTLPAAGTAPAITTQPANGSVTVGQTASFSVSASGTATLTYQWQKNGGNIGGATSASYTTPATVAGDNGNTYRVVVTNGYGSVTSNSATLTVNAATNPVTASTPTVALAASPGSATPVSVSFSLTNTSGGTITVALTDAQGWLTTSPGGSVSIGAGGTATITVIADPTGLSGVVNGTLTLTNSPGGQVRNIPVTLDLTAVVIGDSGAGGKKSGCAVSTGLGRGTLAAWLMLVLGAGWWTLCAPRGHRR